MVVRSSGLGFLLALVATGAAADPPLRLGAPAALALDDGSQARLEAGEILVEELEPTGGSGLATRALGVVAAPPARVWPVVRDCHRFAEFMPRMKRSERRRTQDGQPTCFLVVDLPFPLADVKSEVGYVLERVPGEGFRRRWFHLSGDYHHNSGSWTALPWGEEGSRTLLVYHSEARPKRALPDFVIRSARRRQLPQTFQAIEARAQSAEVSAE